MTSARSVCMNVSRVSGVGLCGVGSIVLREENYRKTVNEYDN